MSHADTFFSELVRTRTDYGSVTRLGEAMGIPLASRLRNARKARRMPSRATIDAVLAALPEVAPREIEVALLMDANPDLVEAVDLSSRRAKQHVSRVLDSMPQDKRDVLLRIIDDIVRISR